MYNIRDWILYDSTVEVFNMAPSGAKRCECQRIPVVLTVVGVVLSCSVHSGGCGSPVAFTVVGVVLSCSAHSGGCGSPVAFIVVGVVLL